MDSLIVGNLEYCGEIVQDTVDLLYYSHFSTIILSLFISSFVFFKNRSSVAAKLLFVMCLTFALWTSVDLTVWLTYDFSALSVFLWAFFGIFYLLIFVFAYIFFAVFSQEKDDISLGEKTFLSFLIAPVILLMPFQYNVVGYDAVDCIVTEGTFYSSYYYLASLLIIFAVFLKGILVYKKTEQKEKKQQILYLLAGLIPFLSLFFSLGFLVSYLVNNGVIGEFGFEQYGLFGMPIFVAIIGYIVVRFKAFDVKLIGAQALIFILVALIGSQFFYAKSQTDYTLDALTLIAVLIVGYFLIRSVKKEIERKEQLEKLSYSLEKANDRLEELDKQKSEFISIASHQLRTPLTAIRGYISLALEGAYGKVKGTPIEDIMNKMYTIDLRLSQLVEDLLNVSKIEAGKVQYKWESVTLDPIVSELYDMFAVLAEKKGLKLHMIKPETQLPVMKLDINKIKEILSNLIDNAIKYTEKGSVTIRVEQDATVARVVIEDTGIGISKEDALRLFGKFIRTETTQKMDAGGSGLGLFVGKTFVEGHGGRVYATSEGVGKGSSFIVELPLINPNAS